MMGRHSIIRIWELASTLDIDSRQAIRLARAHSVEARSASSRLSHQTAIEIIDSYLP